MDYSWSINEYKMKRNSKIGHTTYTMVVQDNVFLDQPAKQLGYLIVEIRDTW